MGLPLPHDLTTKTICILISTVMAVGMYVSLIQRIHRRHHTRDLSKGYCWLNFLVQINNGVLAISEHAPFLTGWYAAQTLATLAVLVLVYRYWDYPNP
jgi:hypothetical protein